MALLTSLALSVIIAGPGCERDQPHLKEKPESKRPAVANQGQAGASRPTTIQPSGPDDAKAKMATPPDVAAPPAGAARTAGGVAYKVLSAGPGGPKPSAQDRVKVHYSGWTTDGNLFDSSWKRGQPATFGLNQVIPGWTEGLQVMSVGDAVRFWIPEEMAYKGREGAPQGMLVFDVELLEVTAAPVVPPDVAAPPATALKSPKGVSYVVLQPGSGTKTPRVHDKVKVHYSGWTTDGKMFDSSVMRGSPAEFSLQGVVAGWTDAIPLMVVGQKNRLWIPSELAYDDQPGRPAGMLVFDVELLGITELPPPPETPADVAAPPKDAKKTALGVFYKVLTKGTETKKPTAIDKVTVHYTGWTTDGKMFDSSVTRGEPATFPLQGVIPGWTDGLQVMAVGDRVRFWIPEDLAYKGQAGAPAGMLVFDVELLAIP